MLLPCLTFVCTSSKASHSFNLLHNKRKHFVKCFLTFQLFYLALKRAVKLVEMSGSSESRHYACQQSRTRFKKWGDLPSDSRGVPWKLKYYEILQVSFTGKHLPKLNHLLLYWAMRFQRNSLGMLNGFICWVPQGYQGHSCLKQHLLSPCLQVPSDERNSLGAARSQLSNGSITPFTRCRRKVSSAAVFLP